MAAQTNQSPRVSVVIPCFNAERYVGHAIESALRQLDVPVEVILVDDGSNDATLRIAAQIAARDGRLRIYKNPENRGPSYSRNRGIDEARGDWIALLDADDFFEADRLKKILDVAEREQADLVADNLIIVSENGEALSYAFDDFGGRPSKVIGLLDLLDMNRPLVAGVKLGYSKPLMRKDFLRNNELRYNEDIRVGEDFLLYGECILKGGRFLLLREAGYCYRLVEGSVTRSETGGWRTAQLLEANRCLMSSLNETADRQVRRLMARREGELEALLLYIELVGLAKKGHWGQFVASASRRVDLLPDVIRAAGRAIRRKRVVARGGTRSFNGLSINRKERPAELAAPPEPCGIRLPSRAS